MSEVAKPKWAELRKPFPKETVGKIKMTYGEVDYVGHAAVTDRLLEFDPEWSWEPLALDELGLPALDSQSNLWIKLTIAGVTRLGVGDGKNMKERIGDALRNAAMRFGVALDLWSKDELESHVDHPELKNEKPTAPKATAELIPPGDMRRIRELMQAQGLTGTKATDYCQFFIKRNAPTTKEDATTLIRALEAGEVAS